MKKVILILLVNLLCGILAKAGVVRDYGMIIDTLPQRVINGLTVIPIRVSNKESTEVFWELRIPGFEKKYQHFESKYPGCINYNLMTEEIENIVRSWPDYIWQKIVPAEIKTRVKDISGRKDFEITLHLNKEGDVFDITFWMSNNIFQVLDSLAKNTMKELYDNISKESCEIIKQAEFLIFDEHYPGKEYISIKMPWAVYDMLGTFNFKKALKEADEELKKVN